MRAVSSHEAHALSNTEIAQETDRRLLFVAQNLPQYAFRGGKGDPIVVCRQLDVGEISCTNTGMKTFEVVVKLSGYNDQLGFSKEYSYPFGALVRPGDKVHLIDNVESITPEEFDDCPDIVTFLSGFSSLFEKFTAELPPNGQRLEAADPPYERIAYLQNHRSA